MPAPIPLLLVLLLAAPAMAGEIYRHKDKFGNPVFTDQPPEDAEAVELGPVNTLPAAPRPAQPATPAPEAPAGYTQLRLVGPQSGTTLRNPTADIVFGVSTDAPLQAMHTFVFVHNGQVASRGTTGFRLDPLERGEHEVVAEIRDEHDRVLIRSEPIVLQILRNAVPQNRVRPR